MTTKTILVQAGTGKTGRRVAALLRERGHVVKAASRSGDTRFDWADRTTWGPALSGVDAAYVVPLDATSDGDYEVVRDFAAEAAKSGVRKLVLLSARDADLINEGKKIPEHAIRESGLPWTILRPVWFHQNFTEDPLFDGMIRRGEALLATGEGLEPFIDADDIAEVAVVSLTEDGHDGQSYDLSGPGKLTFAQAVRAIGAELGRDITVTELAPAEHTGALVAQGVPREYAELITSLFGNIREGNEERLSDGVQRALGRAPRSFADYVKREAAAGAWR
ncbi:uncharacterized protein YbjT (DUF2867 family) [Crossiella equi]|uniref:Uncharacterized protein YbjT (DUF2867 family) n=1 Tax=Crossiella equi TaxID=130796 RepID=A0ABS5ABA7_9PSEU|nr:NAD(P)H-binding protein [Crossiella equi]MBP2473484.1 uncharacterized protein YbjT (DUF2867 family) [Crossiella equi]